MLCSIYTDWYYFQDGETDLAGPSDSLRKAFWRALLCTGTVAIGSLLICFATCLRIILFVFTAEQKAVGADANCVQKCL